MELEQIVEIAVPWRDTFTLPKECLGIRREGYQLMFRTYAKKELSHMIEYRVVDEDESFCSYFEYVNTFFFLGHSFHLIRRKHADS